MFEKIKDKGTKGMKHVKDNALLYTGGIALGIASFNYLKIKKEYGRYVEATEWAINETYLTGVYEGVDNVKKNMGNPEFMNELTNKELVSVKYSNENDKFINSIINMDGDVLITPATTVEFKDREEG